MVGTARWGMMMNERNGHKARNRKFKAFTVWDNRTGELICLDASATEAAKLMGISFCSFYQLVSRPAKKWDILAEYIDNLEEEDET